MIIGSMEDADYRAMEGLAQSDLAWMKKSPQHFLKRKELQKETEAMRFGTVFHAAILERRRFLDSYIVEPTEITIDGKKVELNKRMKAHREYIQAWRFENVDKYIMTQKQFDNLVGMAEAVAAVVKSTQVVSELIVQGQPECVAVWNYRDRKCKGKADLWLPESQHGRVVVDIKKTQDASKVGFARSVHNYNYALQSEWYRRGFQADKVIVIAVEEQFPHAIGVYDMESWSDEGKSTIEYLLDRLDECEKQDRWPWYTDGIELLAPPTWLAAVSREEATGT